MCSPLKYLPSPIANFSVRHVSPPTKAFAPRLTPFCFCSSRQLCKDLREPQCLGERREVQEVAPYPSHHSLLQFLNLEPASPPLAALCAPTFLPPRKRSLHGSFQQKVLPFFHRLCLVFRSSGHLSLHSCIPMAPSNAQLSFVCTLPDHSCPFCLHCLGALFQFFGSSPDPKAKHRDATGHPALPLPSTLRLFLSDVFLLLAQHCFCLTFFQEKKVVRTFLSKEGTPCLFPPALCMPWPTDTPPRSFSTSFCFQMLFLRP
jgi:hypothetical protein